MKGNIIMKNCDNCYYATKTASGSYKCRRKKYDTEQKTCFAPKCALCNGLIKTSKKKYIYNFENNQYYDTGCFVGLQNLLNDDIDYEAGPYEG